MILEVAVLQIIEGQQSDFERDYKTACQYISASKGYMTHSLRKCIEKDNQYILLVEWETLEDHTIGFRESALFKEWEKLLHHYYDPFPTVEHYEVLK